MELPKLNLYYNKSYGKKWRKIDKTYIFIKKTFVLSANLGHKVACTDLFHHSSMKYNISDQILQVKLNIERII